MRSTLFLFGFLVLTVSGCGMSEAVSPCPAKFDSVAWKRVSTLDTDGESERRRLAGELQRCRFLQGASKGRVRRLLGPRSKEVEETRSWEYYVGETDWGIDSDWLFIEFSRKDRVKFVEVGQG